jgi:hypothetical protein
MEDQESITNLRPASNVQYVIAVLTMFLLGVIMSITIIALRPTADALVIVGSTFAVMSPTTLGLLSFMKAQETHLSVNSQLQSYINAASGRARAEGVIEGRDTQHSRQIEGEKT